MLFGILSVQGFGGAPVCQGGRIMAKIGLIGMGNMGKAILKGLLKEMQPEDMVFTAAHRETMEKVKKETNVPFAPPMQRVPGK